MFASEIVGTVAQCCGMMAAARSATDLGGAATSVVAVPYAGLLACPIIATELARHSTRLPFALSVGVASMLGVINALRPIVALPASPASPGDLPDHNSRSRATVRFQ